MRAEELTLTKTDRAILASYETMLDGLALYLGDGYEIVLHSLEDLSHSVIKIINGHYTQRTVGAPITDLALTMLHDIQTKQTPQAMVYFNHKDGRPLKSTTIPVVGEKGRIIGLVCMNFQCDMPLSQFVAGLFPQTLPSAPPKETERFNADIEDVISVSLEKARQQVYASPEVASVNRNKEIVRLLYKQGVFNIKDAVIQVADRLGISKNTVYLHLRNLKHD